MTEAELKAQRIADLASNCDDPEVRVEILRLLKELGAEVGQAVAAANEAESHREMRHEAIEATDEIAAYLLGHAKFAMTSDEKKEIAEIINDALDDLADSMFESDR